MKIFKIIIFSLIIFNISCKDMVFRVQKETLLYDGASPDPWRNMSIPSADIIFKAKVDNGHIVTNIECPPWHLLYLKSFVFSVQNGEYLIRYTYDRTTGNIKILMFYV